MRALRATLFPVPVEPAMSRWGMTARSVTGHAAVDVLAQGEAQFGGRLLEDFGLEDVAELDDFALLVRDLDAERGLARDALDPDRLGLQGQGQVFGQVRHLADFDPRAGVVLVGRDDGPGVVFLDLAVDVEFAELLLDTALLVEELGLVDLFGGLAGIEKRERRILIVALLAEVGEEERFRRGRGDQLGRPEARSWAAGGPPSGGGARVRSPLGLFLGLAGRLSRPAAGSRGLGGPGRISAGPSPASCPWPWPSDSP